MGRRFAIVTTTRRPGRKIQSFVDYHRAIGFERIYLYFDDPFDPDIELVNGVSHVLATPCDIELRRQWEQTPLYAANAPFLSTEVMARQILNACHALRRAREDGIDWLFHFDDDELFYPTDSSLDELFDEVESDGAQAVHFLNMEAVIEQPDIQDPFRETIFFKQNPALVSNEQHDILTKVMTEQQLTAHSFFTAYVNGKSAVSTKSQLLPDGVHGFAAPALHDPAERRRTVVDCFGPCFVLHYPNASFRSFIQKYRFLGQFPDYFWGTDPIPKGAFHRDARDVVMRGDDAEALRFYMKRVVTSPNSLSELRSCGLIDRIDYPMRILTMSAR